MKNFQLCRKSGNVTHSQESLKKPRNKNFKKAIVPEMTQKLELGNEVRGICYITDLELKGIDGHNE